MSAEQTCPTCEKPRDMWGKQPTTYTGTDDTPIEFCGQHCQDLWIANRIERAAALEEWAFDATTDTAAQAGARLHLLFDEVIARLDRAVALCQSAIDESEKSYARTFDGEPFKACVTAQDLIDILQPRKAPAE